MSRRLPIYILIDNSGSMRQQHIQAVKNGLDALYHSLCLDPHTSDSVALSIISYGREPKVLLPMTDLENFDPENLDYHVSDAAPTNLGEGLEVLLERYPNEIKKNTAQAKGDWLPILVVMTDGAPTDVALFNQTARIIRENTQFRFARVIVCAAGPDADRDSLSALTSEIVQLDKLDQGNFQAFCKFISDTASQHSQTPNAPLEQQPKAPKRFIRS